MLRFLISVTLRLLIVFMGIGLLLTRQWGWSEYASPELYVVYNHLTSRSQYFLLNTDGTHQSEKLTWKDEGIKYLDCSPDGHTLAFMTDMAHLYVMTNAGILFDQVMDRNYMGRVANNGTVTWSGVKVDANGISAFTRPDHGIYNQDFGSYDQAMISPSGIIVWSKTVDQGLEVRAKTGDMTAYFHYGYGAKWLASEQIFVFDNQPVDSSGGRYLFDTVSGNQVHIHLNWVTSAFSPDATQVAFLGTDQSTKIQQFFSRKHFLSSLYTNLPTIRVFPFPPSASSLFVHRCY